MKLKLNIYHYKAMMHFGGDINLLNLFDTKKIKKGFINP